MDDPLILQHLGEVIENDRTRTVTKRYFPIDIYTYEIPFTSPAKIKYYFEPAQLYTKYRTKCFHFYSPHTIKIQSSTIMFMFTIFDIIILGRVIIIISCFVVVVEALEVVSAWTIFYLFVISNISDSSTSMDHRRSYSISRLKTIMANKK